MVELKALNPIERKLPLSIGGALLEALDLGALTSLSPLADPAALSEALEAAHGVELPKPGLSTGGDDVRCLWFGRAEFLLLGPVPNDALAQNGVVVDLSDAWCAVSLSGAASENVLARLIPLDLRSRAFPVGATARTQLQHMNVSITRVGVDRFMILAFRSMAATLVHDLKNAMEGVAARD